MVVIPLVFMGSLLSESFFGVPGLGSYTIDALQAQDFAVVRSMVFIGSLLYILGLLLTDLSYTLVDPRRSSLIAPDDLCDTLNALIEMGYVETRSMTEHVLLTEYAAENFEVNPSYANDLKEAMKR